jgi:hypothetical protein
MRLSCLVHARGEFWVDVEFKRLFIGSLASARIGGMKIAARLRPNRINNALPVT